LYSLRKQKYYLTGSVTATGVEVISLELMISISMNFLLFTDEPHINKGVCILSPKAEKFLWNILITILIVTNMMFWGVS
jgi:hypothetical protein